MGRYPVQLKLDTTGQLVADEIYALFDSWVIWRDSKRARDKARMEAVSEDLFGASRPQAVSVMAVVAQKSEWPLRPSTRKNYRDRIGRVAQFFGERKAGLPLCTREDVIDFVNSMPSASDQRSRYLELIHQLQIHHARLWNESHPDSPPIAPNTSAQSVRISERESMALLRHNDPSPVGLSEPARDKFIAWFQRSGDEGAWIALRDRAICAMMLGAGLTPVEALSLQLNDLHYDTPENAKRHRVWKLRIPKSGIHGVRETPIADYARHCLASWLDAAHELRLVDAEHPHIFPKSQEGPGSLEPKSFNRRFDAICVELGVLRTTPRALRYSWAVANLRPESSTETPDVKFQRHERVARFLGLRHVDSLKPYLSLLNTSDKVK